MDDFSNDDELAVIADALGMFDKPDAAVSKKPSSSPPLARLVSRSRKTPCSGSVAKPKVEVAVKDTRLEDRVSKLGAVTLDGFEKLSRRIGKLEQERNPSSFSLSSLNKTCLIAILGGAGLFVIMGVFAIVFHLLGMTPQ